MQDIKLERLAELADKFNDEWHYYTDKLLACWRKKVSVVHHRYIEEHVGTATWEMMSALESRDNVRLSLALNHENRVFNVIHDYLSMTAKFDQITNLWKERTKMLISLKKALAWFNDREDNNNENNN